MRKGPKEYVPGPRQPAAPRPQCRMSPQLRETGCKNMIDPMQSPKGHPQRARQACGTHHLNPLRFEVKYLLPRLTPQVSTRHHGSNSEPSNTRLQDRTTAITNLTSRTHTYAHRISRSKQSHFHASTMAGYVRIDSLSWQWKLQ